ncbi:MAG TPA: HD domain-containing phosphohydrolase [Thermotogota bacterium]|nr:HD domain-containing phosphohydrolase [Thermotogota bacterium]HPJ88370.1 HD domain-containing phosphohydrolase [Thermotogota bacterium]HPR95462.1 HD domain-containing phosphohydrolase [Thermotogota bacterium]
MKKFIVFIMIFFNVMLLGTDVQLTENNEVFHEIKPVTETTSEESIKLYRENTISTIDFLEILVIIVAAFTFFTVASIVIQRKEMKKKNELIKVIDRKNKQIQNIIDNVPSMLSIKDQNGKFLFTNRKNADFFGMRPNGLKDRYMNEFTHIDKEVFGQLAEMDKRVLETGEDLIAEMALSDYWGNQQTLKITKTLFMHDEDELSRVVLTSASDISELKAKNYEIQSSYEQIKAISDELTDAYKANEELIEKIEKLADISFFRYNDKNVLLKNFFNRLDEFIPEFKKGVLVTREENQAIFLDAKGYDCEELNRFGFQDAFFLDIERPEVFEDILDLTRQSTPTSEVVKLESFFKEVKKTLLIPIRSEKRHYGNISVDMEGENADFSQESKRFATFFSNLLSLYLQIDENKSLLNESYVKFSNRLAYIAEAYDEVTGNHIDRVGELSAYIAEKLNLSTASIEEIRHFAPLHDIGKILVPKSILKKRDKLTDEEWEKMKKHTLYGKRLLGDDDYFNTALNIALYHHERYDGSGYPYGIKGEAIPLEAAIVSLVDVYDALRSERPYKSAYTHDKAISIICGEEGRTQPTHFNPVIFDCFMKNQREIAEIWDDISTVQSKTKDGL